MNEEQLKNDIQNLINDFRINYQRYKHEQEANTETKLVEPLFKFLGWNKEDFVKRESAHREGKKGFADYGFKIDGKIVFFLEVKRVGIPLEKEADKQVISYALSKRIPFAVSTNFEELKIFCVEQENATTQIFRVFKKPEDYITNLQNLSLLSKESFEKNLILKEAENEGRLKKRMSINKILLDDLMHIRKLIADDIEKTYSQKYDVNDKEEIVQRIIDRLIFIRRCEDVGMNPENLYLEEVKHLPDNKAYPKLKSIFEKYNDIYNSGLFVVGVDNDCDVIKIDGLIIKKLIGYLYESKDKEYIYNFDWIDADVLGQVYEQYLGKLLQQTKSGRTKLKDGQAHKKEQGIYYTPTYVVDYIVRNTLVEALKNKKIKTQNIEILDCACGSGSFLIKAFDYLYENLSSKEEAKQMKFDSQGMYSIKTEILKRNIYGVDLDNKAVEITKLNLLLKAAEKNRKLPEELDLHIRKGNSLVDDESVDKNAFNWVGDFQEGNFDIVVGNPPYILMQPQNTPIEQLNYFKDNYKVAQYKVDTYHLFFERGINLLKEGGLLGFITSNTYLMNIYLSNLRKFILSNCKILQIITIPKEVFVDASVDTSIIILQKEKNEKLRENNNINIYELSNFSKGFTKKGYIKQIEFTKTENSEFMVKNVSENKNLLSKIEENTNLLGKLARISFGLQTKDKKTYVKKIKENSNWKPCIDGGDIFKYNLKFNSQYFLHDLKIKAGGCWDEKTHNTPEKIVIRQIGIIPIATLDTDRYYSLNTIYNLTSLKEDFNYRYILGLLNSNLIGFYWKSKFSDSKVLFPKVKKAYLDLLPIKQISTSQQQILIQFVDRMIILNVRLNEIGRKTTSETKDLNDKINNLNKEINEEIYKLYGITREEQKIIEEGLR